ncbi:transposase domain-containing protein [Parasphingorhabdus sp.]|uniref:transposase domain-containing protein n=1 Tax=Parasphingorhabdus sp. TaxID=2709688 RepID=UPI0035931C62
MKHIGTKIWYSAAELADMSLPGLPRDKRKVNMRAKDERWALAVDDTGQPLMRRRSGRGGGTEFHISVLPQSARTELIKRGIAMSGDIVEAPGSASQLWSWYDSQNDTVKTEALRRLAVVDQVDALEAAGLKRSAAVPAAADHHKIGASTLWGWLSDVEGIAHDDRLPVLAPKRKGGGKEAEIDADIWQYFKSDYLRAEKPTLTSCYYRAKEIADARGIALPIQKTFARKLKREVDARVIMLKRDGEEALRQSMPAQKRTVAGLHALEMVNIDGHKFDVFAKGPDGKVFRPLMVATQDIYSRKILSWRIGGSESAVQTRLTFADLFRDFGIPKACVLDNGRAFASKWITGGAKSRFRFKIREEEPTGILTALGIKIHWALPYRGQSKPIERGFRDLCDTIAKHPSLAGCYTGNNVDAKPENYGDRAVDIETFKRIAAKGIALHNARPGRRTEMARGRSFDDAFNESYAVAPIGKATPEQLRMALLAADQKKVDRRTGVIELYGNMPSSNGRWRGPIASATNRSIRPRRCATKMSRF